MEDDLSCYNINMTDTSLKNIIHMHNDIKYNEKWK